MHRILHSSKLPPPLINQPPTPPRSQYQGLERSSGKKHTLTQLLDAFKNR